MKTMKKRLSRAEMYFLILNFVAAASLLLFFVSPGLFNQSYWFVKLGGLNVPVVLLANLLLVVYWLARTRYYFLISLAGIAAYVVILFQKYNSDTILKTAFDFVKAPGNGAELDSQHNYLGTVADLPDHPRLILYKNGTELVNKAVGANANMAKLQGVVLKAANAILTQKTRTLFTNGKELVLSTRESFRRLFFLSYAWRITGNPNYKTACISEMISAASADDWQPRNYSATAEITLGLAIAYDWLYADVAEGDRLIIEKAIFEKGIKPSLDAYYNSWLDEASEENQLGNAAMILGAIAAYDYDSKTAKTIINRSIASLADAMNIYKPDGVHSAGSQFGSYGTTYNAMAIDALRKMFGQDFGLAQKNGFLSSGSHLNNLTGTSGLPFNYSDGEPKYDLVLNPGLYWLAKQTNDASLTYGLQNVLANGSYKDLFSNPMLPLVLIWAVDAMPPKTPGANFFISRGKKAAVLMRTSWDAGNGIFLGLKAGSPSNMHGHMDAGSFVLDALGKRWATDLGGDNLTKVNNKGINVFDMTQESRRWDIFRNSVKAHNTLTVNTDRQVVSATADIIKYSDKEDFMYAVSDLSDIYAQSLKSEKRGVAIVAKKYVQIRDELETSGESTIRWKIVTPASVKLISPTLAELSQGDKKFYLRVLEPTDVKLEMWSASPTYGYESPNNGHVLLGFKAKTEGVKKLNLTVLMGDDMNKLLAIQNVPGLQQW